MEDFPDGLPTLQVPVCDLICLFQFEEFKLGKHLIQLVYLVLGGLQLLLFSVDKLGEEEVVLLDGVLHGFQQIAETSVSHRFVIFMNLIKFNQL